ncbi:Uncharacterised protein [Candidatus Anstonella stagnisolia]|nr:Uncharacterised protein [Candidatus Anstonella stagnisolia]
MAARINVLQLTGIGMSTLYLPAPKKPPRPDSFASFISMLPMTDRLQVAQHLAKENKKKESFSLLGAMRAHARESAKPSILKYMKLRDNALSKLGFSLNHSIIKMRPPAREKPTELEIELSKAAIYCCILTNDDELVHELARHFKLDDAAVRGRAHDAATTEIRRGRYISAMEIARAYGLDGIREKLNELRTLFEKINPTKSLQMFGSLNETDGSG